MFEKLSLTNKGVAILAAILTGDQIKFTKVKLGKATSAPTDIPNMNDVQLTAQSLTVQRANEINENTINIGCNLFGSDVTEAFNWSEIGIFAQNLTDNSEEVLFSYVYTDNPVPIPKGGTVVEMLIDFEINVGEADNVNISLDSSLVFATLEDAEKLASTAEKNAKDHANTLNNNLSGVVTGHINNKSNPHEVTKENVGLGSVENYGKATSTENQQGVVDNKIVTPAGVKKAIESYGVISEGNIKFIASETQPSTEAGKTILWVDTSS